MSAVSVIFCGTESTILVDFLEKDDLIEPEIDIEFLKSSLRRLLQETNYSRKNRLNHSVLHEDEMDCLAYHSQRGCPESQELLLIFCGRLIHSQAKKAVSPHKGDKTWDYNDLFNSGCIGILNALKTWRISRGHFTSWAVYSIIGRISEEKRRLYSPIFIKNEHLWRLSLSLPYLTLKCEAELGRSVSLDELAEWINNGGHAKQRITAKDLDDINRITTPRSLDEQIEDVDDSAIRLADTVEDTESEQPDQKLLDEEIAKSLYELLSKLTRRQSLIVQLYHGLDEETRNTPGLITFTDVVRILKKRFPNEHWSIKSCEESNRRALQKLKLLAEDFTY